MLIQIIPLYKGENYPMYMLELTTVVPLGHRPGGGTHYILGNG